MVSVCLVSESVSSSAFSQFVSMYYTDTTPHSQTIFYALFLVAMVIDGIFVALGNVCAIDCGGLDLLAGQQNIPIDDTIRNHFNSLFQVY